MKKVSAFTLIELLVVIAIIAILAAILFPVFAQAREKARAITCISNQKQIGLAVLQYVQDYDETYPAPWRLAFAGHSQTQYDDDGWDHEIQAYAGTKTSFSSQPLYFLCPSDSISKPPDYGGFRKTYSMNAEFAASYCGPWNGCGWGIYTTGQSLAAVPAPAGTILICEMPWEFNLLGDQLGEVAGDPEYQLCGSSPQFPPCPDPNGNGKYDFYGTGKPLHSDGWNYLFADGHAKYLRPEATIGRGINGSGKDANGNPCKLDLPHNDANRPCGMWSLDEND